MVVPSLAALLADPALEVFGDEGPFAWSVLVDQVDYALVLFLGPGTFDQIGLEMVLPSGAALNVCSARQVVWDFTPAHTALNGKQIEKQKLRTPGQRLWARCGIVCQRSKSMLICIGLAFCILNLVLNITSIYLVLSVFPDQVGEPVVFLAGPSLSVFLFWRLSSDPGRIRLRFAPLARRVLTQVSHRILAGWDGAAVWQVGRWRVTLRLFLFDQPRHLMSWDNIAQCVKMAQLLATDDGTGLNRAVFGTHCSRQDRHRHTPAAKHKKHILKLVKYFTANMLRYSTVSLSFSMT